MNELALFAGAGGGILGGKLLGWRTVCAVERDAYAAQILAQRQNDGAIETFPIWSDVCSFDGTRWRGAVDVISGGFPCQDISLAGKGQGISGARSGLWKEMARIIREVGPRFVFVENSPALTTRGLDAVLGDLAEMGFDARWGVLGADDVGAPHIRKRIWILANTTCERCGKTREHRCNESSEWPCRCSSKICNTNRPRWEKRNIFACGESGSGPTFKRKAAERADWWNAEPDVGRMANGVAFRVDRLKAIGNGQVPRVAASALQLLMRDTQ